MCLSMQKTMLIRFPCSAIHAAQHHSEGKAMVVVRIPKHDELSLSTALDAGAAGIVIPHVESAQEVKDKIKEMYYRKSRLQLIRNHAMRSQTNTLAQLQLASAPSAHGPSRPASQTHPSTRTTTSTSPRPTSTSASSHKSSRSRASRTWKKSPPSRASTASCSARATS